MQISDPRIRSLLRQANAVAAQNKRAAAEQLYRQIIDEAPDVPEAWLGLGMVLVDPEEQQQAYRQALVLDRENEAARAWLARLGQSRVHDGDDAPAVDAEEVTRRYLDEATSLPAAVSVAPEKEDELPVSTENAAPLHPVLTNQAQPAPPQAEALVCANHPGRVTSLRCNRCNKPICTQCARRTPVGYRCKACVREQEDIFYTAEAIHYIIAFVVGVPLAILAAVLVSFIPFWFLLIFIGPVLGTIVGRLTFLSIGRRRGRYIPYLVGGSVVLSALVVLLLTGNWLSIGIYGFLGASSAYYQLK
ncbi:MAG: hypothetical protein KC418_10585 [Anaerolineales bacterium]|nr:hypothetical protein [Anaerolineales bacterium]MCB8951987.1 hypothetical protein [Ardenticatenales bacterium]